MKGWWWLLCWLIGPAWGGIVELKLPTGLVARAEFRDGAPAKPAILLLHGFLQTHEFPVIHRLTESLGSAGFTVLAPTLSLGISSRKQSLACEALNTHTQADAVNEIDAWVKWLKAQKPRGIVLLGHSFGSMQLLAYASTKPDPAIRKFIGVSIIEGRMEFPAATHRQLMRELDEVVRKGDHQVVVQPLSFCRKYRASPASLMSYLAWTPERILKAVNRAALPVTFIMGGQDDRLGQDWLEKLGRTRARLHVIQGANHFMDGEYEFDLMDVVLAELKPLQDPPR